MGKKVKVDIKLLKLAQSVVYDALYGYGIECNCGSRPEDCDGTCTHAGLVKLEKKLKAALAKSKGD